MRKVAVIGYRVLAVICMACVSVVSIAGTPARTMSIYAIAADKPAADPSIMACDVGPISKTYGKTDWLVYSCKDAKSVIAVSAPGNPATPFFFILSPEDGGIRVYGEGNGDKSATKAAFDELEVLTELDVAKLVLESKEHASISK